MNIRFTSSLTPEDENRTAPALLRALAGILDLVPIAYNIRIETSDSRVYQHTGPSNLTGANPESAEKLEEMLTDRIA